MGGHGPLHRAGPLLCPQLSTRRRTTSSGNSPLRPRPPGHRPEQVPPPPAPGPPGSGGDRGHRLFRREVAVLHPGPADHQRGEVPPPQRPLVLTFSAARGRGGHPPSGTTASASPRRTCPGSLTRASPAKTGGRPPRTPPAWASTSASGCAGGWTSAWPPSPPGGDHHDPHLPGQRLHPPGPGGLRPILTIL